VYVFTRHPILKTWTESQKLYAQRPSAFERFGASLAMDDHLLVVGVPSRDRSTQVTTAVSAAPPVGCLLREGGWHNPDPPPMCVPRRFVLHQGAVDVFTKRYLDASNTTFQWVFSTTLQAPNGQLADRLGTSVSLSNFTIVAGTPFRSLTVNPRANVVRRRTAAHGPVGRVRMA
jgi:hypothetical protein